MSNHFLCAAPLRCCNGIGGFHKIDEVGCWHKTSYFQANGILTKNIVCQPDACFTYSVIESSVFDKIFKLTLVYAPIDSLGIVLGTDITIQKLCPYMLMNVHWRGVQPRPTLVVLYK